MTQARFELFTVGTLVVLMVLGVVGYLRGAALRRNLGPVTLANAPVVVDVQEGSTTP